MYPRSGFLCFFRLSLLLLLGCSIATPVNCQPADPVAQAKALIENKQADAAFSLLAPLELRRAGDRDFDYWLGVAALESDRLERATLAFERLLIRNPDFDSARLELARTYLRMGSIDLAEQEFTRLLTRAPNETGRKLLEDYLAEIKRIRERQRFNRSAYIEIGGGRDNNLSSSTRDFSSAILNSFGLPGIVATGNSIRRGDNFFSVQTGVDGIFRLREDRSIFASADLSLRRYREFNDYDYFLANANFGYQTRRGQFDYTMSGFVQSFRQDGAFVDTISAERVSNDRDSRGMNLEVRRNLGTDTQIVLGMQFSALRYKTNPGQDTNQLQMSLALQQQPAWWPGGTLYASLSYGYDDARRPLNLFTETTATRHTPGIRLVAQSDTRAAMSWLSSVGWSRRIDDEPFARATLVQTGRDDLLEVYVRGTWKFVGAWSLQPYAVYVRNKSNIDLYTFAKAEGGVTLRRDFK